MDKNEIKELKESVKKNERQIKKSQQLYDKLLEIIKVMGGK